MRGGPFIAAAAFVALTAGCTGDPPPPNSSTVVAAWVGGEPHSLARIERYLNANLLADPSGGNGSVSERVKSRLLDAYIDEQLLVTEARERGLEVTAREIDAWLEFSGYEDSATSGTDRREEATRTILLQKLEADVTAAVPRPADDEVRDWLSRRQADGDGVAKVRLRSLRFDDPQVARKVAEDIRRGRSTFDEAVVAHGESPDQGIELTMRPETMIAAQRDALTKLKPGQVTAPIELAGGAYLFQYLGRTDSGAGPSAQEALDEIVRARGRAAFRELLDELRKRSEIRLNLPGLPFAYIQDDSVRGEDGIP